MEEEEGDQSKSQCEKNQGGSLFFPEARETCRQEIKMRVADSMSEREKQMSRNVCREVDIGEQDICRAKSTAREQAENSLELGKKGQNQ